MSQSLHCTSDRKQKYCDHSLSFPADINSIGQYCDAGELRIPSWHFQLIRVCCVAFLSDGEGKRHKGEWCNFEMAWWAVHSPTRPAVIPHPSLPPSLPHNPSLHPARIVPPVLFPGHSTMEAWCRRRRAAHCLILCKSQFVADWQF